MPHKWPSASSELEEALTATLLDVDATAYHRDDLGDRPSLSASIANLLLARSPLHAWHAHPKLNPAFERREEDKFSLGQAAHAWFLEGREAFDVCPFDSWRSQAAKEAKEFARENGRIPLLAQDAERVMEMCEALDYQTKSLGLFDRDAGTTEQTIAWTEAEVACRARLDWLANDRGAIHDLKTTKASANPRAWSRIAWSIGVPVQAAFYRRAVQALGHEAPSFTYVVIEVEPPYCLSVVELDEESLAIGNAKVDRALEIWRDCLDSGVWPGYATEPYEIRPPAWERHWLEEQLEEEVWAQM